VPLPGSAEKRKNAIHEFLGAQELRVPFQIIVRDGKGDERFEVA